MAYNTTLLLAYAKSEVGGVAFLYLVATHLEQITSEVAVAGKEQIGGLNRGSYSSPF